MKRRRLSMAGALIKGLLIAVGVTLTGIMLMAAAVIYLGMPDTLIRILNQLLKIVSVLLGTFFAVRKGGEKGLITGAAIGAIYAVAGYVLFCLLGDGNFDITMIMGEMMICTATGALSGALMINFLPSLQHK